MQKRNIYDNNPLTLEKSIKESHRMSRERESRQKFCHSLESNSSPEDRLAKVGGYMGEGPGAAGILTDGGKQQGKGYDVGRRMPGVH